jgi:hypothetical protein
MAKTPFGRHLKIMIGGNDRPRSAPASRSTACCIITFVLAGAIAGSPAGCCHPHLRRHRQSRHRHAVQRLRRGGHRRRQPQGRRRPLPGVYAGVLLLSSINTAINLMGCRPHYTQVIHGLLVLAAVLLDTLKLHPQNSHDQWPSQGKVALVIGAARGIGKAIVERFIEEGANVVLADTEVAAGRATAATPRRAASLPPTSRKWPTPRRPSSLQALERFGRLDIMVQNAGIYPWQLIENTSADEWDASWAVNLAAPSSLARAALAHEGAGLGRILFTSSITGPHVTSPGHGHYSATQGRHQRLHPAAALDFPAMASPSTASSPATS